MIYDTLTNDEILIAKQAVTSSEEQSVAFNRNIPRDEDATLFHRLFHKEIYSILLSLLHSLFLFCHL